MRTSRWHSLPEIYLHKINGGSQNFSVPNKILLAGKREIVLSWISYDLWGLPSSLSGIENLETPPTSLSLPIFS